MSVKVIKDKCIGCGNCVALTDGEIFDFDDEGLATCIKKELTDEDIELARTAIDQCPTEAITEE